MLEEIFYYIDDCGIYRFCELVDTLRFDEEWDFVAFVLENAEMFKTYLESKKEAYEEEYSCNCPNCTNSECSKFEAEEKVEEPDELMFVLSEHFSSTANLIRALQAIREKDPNVKWKKVDANMENGIYYILGISTNIIEKKADLAGQCAKYIDGAWYGFMENDGTADHMGGFVPIAYNRDFFMALDEAEEQPRKAELS